MKIKGVYWKCFLWGHDDFAVSYPPVGRYKCLRHKCYRVIEDAYRAPIKNRSERDKM